MQGTTTWTAIQACLNPKSILFVIAYLNGTSNGKSSEDTTGGGRGLPVVWRKELEKKISINRYLPGQSRGATLGIMAQMDQCPGRRPGVDKETLCDLDHGDIKSTRTQCHQMSPRTEEAPQRLPTTWPQCLGRGVLTCSFQPPSHTPSSTLLQFVRTPISWIPDQTRIMVWGFGLLCLIFQHQLSDLFN